MKISYRTHPILEKLHKGSLGILPIAEDDKSFFDQYMEAFVFAWKRYQPFFKQEINILSNPFVEAAEKAFKKLFDLYADIAVNNVGDFNVSSTLVIRDKTFMIHQDFKKDSEDIQTAFFVFSNQGMPFCYFVDDDDIHQNGWISKSIPNIPQVHNSPAAIKFLHSKMTHALTINMFKKYAQVESKFLPAGQKIKDINCKYLNDTKLDITYLDSKWFTTLVKSDAFNVRGHFRLQPKKKDGEWTKELIWINEFQKTGYTAPARKIKEYPEVP